MAKKQLLPRLTNWSIRSPKVSPYSAPEQHQLLLVGKVYGHPNPHIPDGAVINAGLVRLDEKSRLARSNSRTYQLGNKDQNYERFCQNNTPAAKAAQRKQTMIKTLKDKLGK